MMKNVALFLPALALSGSLAWAQTDEQILQLQDLANAYAAKTYTRQSVHDPSIVVDTITSSSTTTYYVFGSHVDGAKSTNLYNWTAFGEKQGGTTTSWFGKLSNGTSGTVARCLSTDAFATNVVTSVKDCDGNLVSWGNFNGHDWQTSGNTLSGNLWAPDIVFSKEAKKWFMYLSLNSDNTTSSIVCLASSSITGPYVYQGPVVFSCFHGHITHTGFPAANDYKHTDLELALGPLSSLPVRYATANTGSWGNVWPNAIDPCVFYDDNGKLWMSYGSWSGGIFIFELDPKTGLRDYTKKLPYEINGVEATPGSANSNATCDPYFGRKIAGGYYSSGEASYIKKIGKYYFLFMSNGGLVADGGYQMRVFRSENPDGPYVDCHGNKAIYSARYTNFGSNSNTNAGVLLMCGYKWETMPYAEVAQGHNSATVDKKGRAMVVYHTRTNTMGEMHQVRVHQLFLNEDGWLVSTPYEMKDEPVQTQKDVDSKEQFSTDDIVGTYQMMRHTYCLNTAAKAYQSPVNVTLLADGSVVSDDAVFAGSWAVSPGTSHISLTLNDVVYKGVLSRQIVDYTNIPALCISALSSSSGTYTTKSSCTKQVMLWGSKADAKAAIKYTLDNMKNVITNGKKTQVSLALAGAAKLGTSVSWKSSDPEVITDNGTVGKVGKVVLTATIRKDGLAYSQDYEVEVVDAGSIPTYYPVVGGTSTNSAFFTKFSDAYTLAKGKSARFRFYNYTDGVEVWNNWILAVSNVAHGVSGYSEYLILRADPYGWGTYHDASGFKHNFDDDATFKRNMNGALVDMIVTFNDGVIMMDAKVTTKAGKVYSYSYTSKSGISAANVTLFFSVEKAYLTSGDLAPLDRVVADDEANGDSYDIMGRRVGANYKGLTIRNRSLSIKR